MQVSARPRFVDHAARSVYGRQVRRVSDEGGGSGRPHERTGDERRRASARPRLAVAEQTDPVPSAVPRGEALWTLVAAVGGDAENRAAPAPALDLPPVSKAESLYVLLSQVIGDV